MQVLDTVLLAVFVLATSVWVGGLVTITIVAQVARRTLGPADSVAFFRGLGRVHGMVGSGALLLALITGAVLLRHHGWDGLVIAAVVLTIALLAASVIGMAQARRMTVLRRSLTERSGDAALQAQVARGAHSAIVLRVLITVLTLAMVIVGAALAT
ncbi:MAG: hypothetical protein ABI251_16470 [Mycobacteriaceae bacterium]